MTNFNTVQKLASQMYDALEIRKSGDNRDEYFLKDGSPDWMRDVIFTSTDDTSFMIAYEFANRALAAIVDADNDEDSIRQAIDEIEPDVYTADLTSWLAENINHVNWLTDAMENFGPFDDGFNLLATAQQMHKQAVANAVLEALIERADNEPDEDESEEDDDPDNFPDVPNGPEGNPFTWGLVAVAGTQIGDKDHWLKLGIGDNDYYWYGDNNAYSRE